ncbi:MAG: YjbQ family protein, partial [Promethearchaeota archaeon]
IEDLLESIIPYKKNYHHHKTWGDHNGAGHVRSFLIKTSQTFPFQNGSVILGTWQQIIFLELDEKRRSRTIYVQIIGE